MLRRRLWLVLLLVIASGCATSSQAEAHDEDPQDADPLESTEGSPDFDGVPLRDALAYHESIAECMLERGFEYVPTADVGVARGSLLSDSERLWFASNFGYGITIDPLLPDSDSRPRIDPNQAIINALSLDEQEQYFLALNGWYTGPDGGEAQSGESQLPCIEDVAQQTGDLTAEFNNLATRAAQALDGGQGALLDSTAFANALDVFQACLAEEGFGDAGQVGPDIWMRQEAERSGFLLNSDPALDGSVERPVGEDLARLQRLEVSLAVADWNCSLEAQTSMKAALRDLLGES